ncbi:cysteine hydrolase family protein [Pseudorhizobium sp. NPDC055634]
MEDPNRCRHLCIDMQRLFAEDTAWHVPWMEKIREPIATLSCAHPAETIFTRFVPPLRPSDATGTWREYYLKWPMMTREVLGDDMVDLLPELRELVPPATVFDKAVYSPWMDGRLHRHLQEQDVTTLVISGGETDVCVLGAVTGAVDLGYSILLLKDAICSASDETHDATLGIYASRFSTQIQVSSVPDVLDWWS